MNKLQASSIQEEGSYLPVGILIDTCASVYGQEQMINRWIKTLLQQMCQDSHAGQMIRLLAVHYNHSIHPVAEFLPLEQIKDQDLVIGDAFGTTDIGGALLYVLRRIREQTIQWADRGAKVFCPVVIAVCSEYPAPAFDASERDLQLFWGRYRLATKQLRKLDAKQQVLFAVALINDGIPIGASDRCCRIMQYLTQGGTQLFRIGSVGESDIPLGKMLFLAQASPCSAPRSTPWETALEQVLGL